MKPHRMTRNKSDNYKKKEEMLVVPFPLLLVGMIRNIHSKRFKGKLSHPIQETLKRKLSMERNYPRSDHFHKNPLNGMKRVSKCLLLVSSFSTMHD